MPVVSTTGEDGKLTFMELPLYDEQTGEPITYTLTESATPDGHIRLEQPIKVSFTAQEKPVDGIYWQTTDDFLLHEVQIQGWSTDGLQLSTPAAAASTGRACWARAQPRRASST